MKRLFFLIILNISNVHGVEQRCRSAYEERREERLKNFAHENNLKISYYTLKGGTLSRRFQSIATCQKGKTSSYSLPILIRKFPLLKNIPCSYCDEILPDGISYKVHAINHREKNFKSKPNSTESYCYGLDLLIQAAAIIENKKKLN